MASSTARGSSSVSYGAELTFETLVAITGEREPLRMHPEDDTLIRVIAGRMRLTVDGAERMLATGDEAIVPAGSPHRLASAGGETRFFAGFRRAGR